MKLKELASFGCVPITNNDIAPLLGEYRAPKNKVQDMVHKGLLVRLKKGLYVASEEVTGLKPMLELIANHLHGRPSYVSRHSALRLYGLIPEHVVVTQSMTTGRTVEFSTPVGIFSYTNVAADYFSIGVTSHMEENVSFLVATPEKALCDIIVTTPNLRHRFMKGVRTWLEENLRLDMEAFYQMNPSIFEDCAEHSKKSQTMLNLAKLIRHEHI